MKEKCIVKGCNNKKTEGEFVGDICRPCYEMLTTGDISKPSTNFLHKLYLAYEPFGKIKYTNS